MFNTVLVPTDGSDLSEKAATAAIEFARERQGNIVGLSVAPLYPDSPLAEPGFHPDRSQYNQSVEQAAQANVARLQAEAEKAGVPFKPLTILGVDPAAEIVKAASDHGCDIIFIASHGRRGIDRLLLGSVTQKVLASATVPVLVFR